MEDSIEEDDNLIFAGLSGGHFFFKVHEGHFYHNDRCADSHFSWLFPPAKNALYCQAKPGQYHDHQVPSQETVHLSTICWATKLRVIRQHSIETIAQSIESVVATWPHKLSISLADIYSIFAPTLQKFEIMAKDNDPYIHYFLIQYGEDSLVRFCQAILQPRPYWPRLIKQETQIESPPHTVVYEYDLSSHQIEDPIMPTLPTTETRDVNVNAQVTPLPTSPVIKKLDTSSHQDKLKNPSSLITSPSTEAEDSSSQNNDSSVKSPLLPLMTEAKDPSNLSPVFPPIVKEQSNKSLSRKLDSSIMPPSMITSSSIKNVRNELKRIVEDANDLLKTAKGANYNSLLQFKNVVNQYQKLLRKDSSSIQIAKNHKLFKISRLEQWLCQKETEITLASVIAKVSSTPILANEEEFQKLTKFLSERFVIVLTIPTIDDQTKWVLKDMTNYVINYIETKIMDSKDVDFNEDEEDLTQRMIEYKRNMMLNKISLLIDHIEVNKNLKDAVFIQNGERSLQTCFLSIYKEGKLFEKDVKLPSKPTNLRIGSATCKSFVIIEWDYKKLGYPVTFVVQYRLDYNTSWMEKSVFIATAEFQVGHAKQIRVAVKTCIGLSQFSEIFVVQENYFHPKVERHCVKREKMPIKSILKIKRNKILLQSPTDLKIESVTEITAKLTWIPSQDPPRNLYFSYRVRCWSNKENVSSANELNIDSIQTECLLQQLNPQTIYFVDIIAISEDGEQISPSSKIASFTTLPANF